jgi:hypothetical protein
MNEASRIIESYGIPYKKQMYTNSELLKKIIIKDAARHYCSFLSLTNEVTDPTDFTKLIKEDNILDSAELGEDCKSYEFAKMYRSEEALIDDNDNTIYFDKMYDDTNYNIKDDFNNALLSKTDEESIAYLTEQLMKKYKIPQDKAAYQAETLIVGKKKVMDGQYAVLLKENQTNEPNEYYVREKDVWTLVPDFNKDNVNISTDANILCNLQKNCISVYNKCESIQKVDAELKDNILNSIIGEFDKSYELSNKNYKKKIMYSYEYFKYVLHQLIAICIAYDL